MKELIRVRVQYASRQQCCKTHKRPLTLNLLTTTIVAPPSNASKWQMGFNSVFKGLALPFTVKCFKHFLLYGTNNRTRIFRVTRFINLAKAKKIHDQKTINIRNFYFSTPERKVPLLRAGCHDRIILDCIRRWRSG